MTAERPTLEQQIAACAEMAEGAEFVEDWDTSQRLAAAAETLRALPGLLAFARTVIMEGPFSGCDFDGGDLQELAEKHGLIRKAQFDPARHADPTGVAEPGCDWYEFTEIMGTPK